MYTTVFKISQNSVRTFERSESGSSFMVVIIYKKSLMQFRDTLIYLMNTPIRRQMLIMLGLLAF